MSNNHIIDKGKYAGGEGNNDDFCIESIESDKTENLMMNSTEWPSLPSGLASPHPSDTSWELVSPSVHKQHHLSLNNVPPATVSGLSDDEQPLMTDAADDAVVVDLPFMDTRGGGKGGRLLRQRSFSTPDFIKLECNTSSSELFEQDVSEIDSTTIASEDLHLHPHAQAHSSPRRLPPKKQYSTTKAWSGVSFRDIVVSQVNGLANEIAADRGDHGANNLSSVATIQSRGLANKPKTRFIVTSPVRIRAYESSPNLRGLVSPVDEHLILGETDAMEFYYRKAKGVAGRKNGLKMRPDEAKRLDITMYKKELQRQGVVASGR